MIKNTPLESPTQPIEKIHTYRQSTVDMLDIFGVRIVREDQTWAVLDYDGGAIAAGNDLQAIMNDALVWLIQTYEVISETCVLSDTKEREENND